jgi:hypothetical protein
MKYKLQIEKLKQLMESKEQWLETKLKARDLEIDALKQRFEVIQDLENQLKELKADNERLFNALPIELARGFSLWLLCNYNTSEEGMGLCWIDAETGTKHGNNEVFEIYLNGLK